MKVAYILNVFPKISETFILNEIIEVQNNGIDVEVFAFSPSIEVFSHSQIKSVKRIKYFSPEKKSLGIVADHLFWIFNQPVRYFKTLSVALNRKNGIAGLFFFSLHNVRAIVKDSPDVLHAHFGVKPSDMAMLVNRLTDIPYTFTTHRFDIFDQPPANYALKSSRAIKHITISQYNKDYLVRNFGVDPQTIDIIHCGINFSRITNLEVPKVKNQIICIARLEPEKGLDKLIEACAVLSKRVDFKCIIVGDGSLRARLADLITKNSLTDKVMLLGYRTSDEIFSLLKQSSVMVLASRSEGIPVSLMEAMALRTPVIATRITGIPELVEDGVSGFLFEVDDVYALVEKIEKILKNDSSCTEFCEHAYRKVFRDFNLSIEVKKLINVWRVG